MTERLREQLSALADDELDESEVELLLRRYERDRELQVCWNAYQVIGESIRLGHADHGASRISERVGAALDEERGAGTGKQTASANRLLKVLRPMAAVAVAASVGVVAVLLVRQPLPVDAGTAPPAQTVPRQASVQRIGFDYDAVTSVRWDQGSEEVRDELNEYLFDHNINAPSFSSRSMLPYVHMATLIEARTPAARRAAASVTDAGK